jgi:hypothetical protein
MPMDLVGRATRWISRNEVLRRLEPALAVPAEGIEGAITRKPALERPDAVSIVSRLQ